MNSLQKLLNPSVQYAIKRSLYTKEMRNLLFIPPVEIKMGKFRYILVQLSVFGDQKSAKMILRSAPKAKHITIYDDAQKRFNALGLCTQCFGGGYMDHDYKNKTIRIYGKSKAVGRADHNLAQEMLETRYPLYHITVTDRSIF